MTAHTTPPSDAEIMAAEEFVKTMLPRADDMKSGYYPLWHGWALRDAFWAGARFARLENPPSDGETPRSDRLWLRDVGEVRVWYAHAQQLERELAAANKVAFQAQEMAKEIAADTRSEKERRISSLELADWPGLHQLAVNAVCPINNDPTTVFEINMVKTLEEFGRTVLEKYVMTASAETNAAPQVSRHTMQQVASAGESTTADREPAAAAPAFTDKESDALKNALRMLDNATMRVGSFGNMEIKVVRRDEAEAIMRDALRPAVLASLGDTRSAGEGRKVVAHPEKDADLYLCCADGEGSHEFKVCRGYEGIAAFYEAMTGRDEDGTLDSLKRTFDDPDEWSNDGAALKLELYCARFYIWKVSADELVMPAGTRSASGERVAPDPASNSCRSKQQTLVVPSETVKRVLDALRGMVGLVQLVQNRYPDFPVDNHRVIEAMSALNEINPADRNVDHG